MPMTLDTEDRVPVPHFTQRLWEELADLHDELGGDDRRPLASTSRSRRRSAVVVAAAVAAAAAAVAAGVVLVQPDGHDVVSVPGDGSYAPAPAPNSFDTGGADLVAQLVEATRTASAGLVVHTTTRSASGRSGERWEDWTTERYRSVALDPHGEPIEEIGGALLDWSSDDASDRRATEDDVLRIVSHCRREVTDESGSGMTGNPAWPFSDAPSDLATPDDVTVVVDGSEVVDGTVLARVRVVETGEVVLVDPATSLAVRGTSDPGTADEVTTTYEYLPRSPENLALVAPPAAPDEYAAVELGSSQGEIDAPPWDDDRPIPEPDCSDLGG